MSAETAPASPARLADPASPAGSRQLRWLLLAAAVVAACITGFVILNTRELAQAQQEAWRLALQTQLDGVVEQTERWLEEREDSVKAVASFEPLVQLHGRLRQAGPTDASGQVAQWRADLRALLAPTLQRHGVVGYLMATSQGRVLADSGTLAGQTLDDPAAQDLIRKTLVGPRYTHVTLPMSWPRGLALGQAGQVILAAAAIWPRGAEMEPGVLVLVIDPRVHFDDIFKRARTGRSGETYAVSPDGVLLTPSRFEIEGISRGSPVAEPAAAAGASPGTALPVLTRAAKELVQRRDGIDLQGYLDYRGVEVMGAWRWAPRYGLGVVTEIDRIEAVASVRSLRRQSVFTIVSTLFLMGSLLAGFLWWTRRMAAAQERLQEEHRRANELSAASQSAEHAVRERETHLRMLLDAFPGYLAITDKQNRYVYINRELADIIGSEPEAVIGRHLREVLDAESAAEIEAAFAHPPGQHLKSEVRLSSRHGRRVRYLERHRIVGPVYADNVGINFSFGFDITHARRGQELEAIRSRAMEMITGDQPLRDILLQLVQDVEAMSLGSLCSVQVLDAQGRHIRLSLSQSMPACFDQGLQGLEMGQDKGTFSVAALTGQRCVVAHADGHPTWAGLPGLAEQAGVMSSWSEPIVGRADRVLGTFTVCHATALEPDNLDLYIINEMAQLASVAIERDRTTARLKDQEDTLREQQRRLQRAIDNMLDGFVRARMDDTLVMVNDALVTMLGYGSREELLGRPSKALYARHEDWEHLVATLMSGRQLRNFRGQARRKDGGLVWVEISSHLDADANSELSGIEAVVRDITQQIEFEDALKDARNAAQAAADARGSFLANMSHEIRTPMNAIIGLTELALRTELTARQQDYLGKVRQAALSLLGLLNDILDFSKIESGRLDLEEIPFNLDEVMSQLASVMSVQVEEKGLELLFARQPDVPVHLVGDPLRLGQVLTNLCGNARKFTQAGDIVVATRVVEQAGGRVRLRFSVQDSGMGMTPEQVQRLFRPFTQADASTTRRFGGTGLGLAISRQLVEMMGGRIWVDSEPGTGSDFQFELEFGLGQASPAALSTQSDALQRLRVLVVDDNPHVQEVLRLHLEEWGCRVEVCAHAQASIERLKALDGDDPVRLVLMDDRLPGLRGLTAAHRIKLLEGLHHVPRLILLTGASTMADDEAPGWAEVDEALAKPVSPTVLFRVMLGVMGAPGAQHGVRARPRPAGPAAQSQLEALRGIQGARVLLVEDNAINQQVARELLEQAGLVVELAHNGQEALDRLDQASYDVVLMDLQMPVMDGYTATQHIRQNPAWKDLPVLAMTANVMAEDRAKVRQAGMSAHLAKPVVPAELFKALLRWIPRRQRSATDIPALTPVSTPTAEGQTQGAEKAATPSRSDDAVALLPSVVTGLDVSVALANVGGNGTLLRKLLADLVQDHGQDVQALEATIAAGELSRAERMAHTLKGVAGTLGATDLQQAAAALEAALRQGLSPTLPQQMTLMRAALQPLMADLTQWAADQGLLVAPSPRAEHSAPAATTVAAPPTVDPAAVEAALEELDALLVDFSPEATERAEALARLLGPGAPTAEELVQLASAFDFDAARGALQRLREDWQRASLPSGAAP